MTEGEAREAVRAEVSAEVFQTLETFVRCVEDRGAVINLVSAADRDRLWERHVLDSLQLMPLASSAGSDWLDLGSGGGFPGLVIAIARPQTLVTLVESNRKKASFLLHAIASTKASAKVEPRRVEDLRACPVDVICARAFAPLRKLLTLAEPHFGEETLGLFPKGRDVAQELTVAREAFSFAVDQHPSRTDPGGTILAMRSVRASRDTDAAGIVRALRNR